MPHVIVHYSANLTALDQLKLLKDLNTALIKTELFSVNDIKSRVFKDEVFLVGVGQTQEAYIHLKLYLLDGRTDAQKQGLGEHCSVNWSNKHISNQFLNFQYSFVLR